MKSITNASGNINHYYRFFGYYTVNYLYLAIIPAFAVYNINANRVETAGGIRAIGLSAKILDCE